MIATRSALGYHPSMAGPARTLPTVAEVIARLEAGEAIERIDGEST